jgi:hypothetical protein
MRGGEIKATSHTGKQTVITPEAANGMKWHIYDPEAGKETSSLNLYAKVKK